MKPFLLFSFLLIFSTASYCQSPANELNTCNNGVKDSNETGVDCGGLCGTCNGEAKIKFNNNEYTTGHIYITSETVENQTGLLMQKDKIKYTDMILFFYYVKNGVSKNFMLNFVNVRFSKIEPKTIWFTGGSDRDMECVNYTLVQRGMVGGCSENVVYLNFNYGGPVKLKNRGKYTYKFEITKVDPLERVMSGNIIVFGETTDGTPVDIKGTLENVNY
jgi:hypothetical protein